MIKANELRIGNWVEGVLFKNDKWTAVKVDSLNDGGIELFVSTDGNIIEPCYFFYSNIRPIPLTPSILEKVGFVDFSAKWGDYEVEIRNGILVFWGIDGCTEGHNIHFPCQHLHQLQNLYFALTSYELEIAL